MLENIFFILAFSFYLISTIYCFWLLISGRKRGSSLLTLVIVGFSFHTLTLLLRSFISGQLPLLRLYEAMTFTAWSIIAVYLLVEFTYQIKFLAAFLLPLAFIALTYAAFLPREIVPLSPGLRSFWTAVHILISFSGHAAFALAFGVGIMYILQENELKSKKLGLPYFRFPSLDRLDDLNHYSLSLGFPLLTVGIFIGTLNAKHIWGSYWNWDLRQIFSLFTWVIYAIVFSGRTIGSWRGKKAAWWSILGFLSIIISSLAINLLAKGYHKY